MNQSPRLHALVVTYRRPNLLESTLAALAEQSRAPDTVTVIDNDPECSARGTVANAGAQYVPTGANLGPAGGLAAGFSAIDGHVSSSDLVVFVDDGDPPPNATILEDLLECRSALLTSAERVAAVGSTGAAFDRRTGLLRRLRDDELVGGVRVQYLGGGHFPIYSVEALREAGCTRPDLFFGFDDLELGLRLESHGYVLFACAEIWARRRAELGRSSMSARRAAGDLQQSPWRRYYGVRNIIWISRTHGRWMAPWVATIRSGFGAAVVDVRRNRSLAAAKPALSGVRDGWLGRLGRTVEPTG